MPFQSSPNTLRVMPCRTRLLVPLLLLAPMCAHAADPFLEYKTASGAYFLTIDEAVADDMTYACERGQQIACRLHSTEATETGYKFIYSHVIYGTPGGPDEVRYSVTVLGTACYSCPADEALYLQSMDHYLGTPRPTPTTPCIAGRARPMRGARESVQ